MWLEFDNLHPAELARIRWSTSTPIGSGETVLGTRDLLPYLQASAFDVCIIDADYVGFTEALRMATLADAFDVNVAAHTSHSRLSALFGAHFCASVPNLQIMEIDVDQPRWMPEILSHAPTIVDGHLELPDRPGWGTDVLEEGVLANPPAESAVAPWLLDYHRKADAL
jgi:L-alanine-DL-glutamate epimerase-like enolase superfamily enzyme